MCEYPNNPDPEKPYSFSAIQAFGFELSHRDQSCRSQKKQRPQAIVNGTTTRSPTFNLVFSVPTSTTSPMNSWPRMSPAFIVGMRSEERRVGKEVSWGW